MTKIRLVTFYEASDCWDITEANPDKEIGEQLEEYVTSNIQNITSPGFVVKDFEVPEDLEKQLILDICNGKSMAVWIENSVDFHSEYYQNWIFFKNKENSWEELN